MRTRPLLACACALLAGPFRAQYTLLDLPRESQHATVTQRLGITDITVDHSRPSVKGRTIWGDVVPYDQVWRAGANENTTITFTDDAQVEGRAVPAGTYGLHMIPTRTTWTVILSKDHTAWGSFFYTPDKDAVRATVTPRPCAMTEQVTYVFTDVTDSSTTLVMRWEKLEVPVRLGVDVHGIILAGLDDQLRGQTAFGWEAWYEAAKYCQLEKIAPDRAMAWVDRSIALRPNVENRMLKADLLAEQGKAAEAEAVRKRMVEEATNAELNTYAYTLLNQGKKAEAVKLFELNAERHPEDPNVFDSLGEGYMTNGQHEAAIKSFKKSLGMHPPAAVKANSLRCLRGLGVDTGAWQDVEERKP